MSWVSNFVRKIQKSMTYSSQFFKNVLLRKLIKLSMSWDMVIIMVVTI